MIKITLAFVENSNHNIDLNIINYMHENIYLKIIQIEKEEKVVESS